MKNRSQPGQGRSGGADHSADNAKQIIASGSICNPSDYLRIRPPYRRYEAERQRASYEYLRGCERYLKALTAYRYHLENPTVRCA